MAVYFMADIHLSEDRPDISAYFKDTLTALSALKPEGVFILGDLFDYYLGDDLITSFQQIIAQQLQALSQTTPVFFQHGNRDFLLGKRYAQQSGLTLLPEQYSLTIDHQRLIIEHGDLLCTDDIGYQRLRKLLRHRLTLKLYQRLPASLKNKLAQWLRQQSQHRGKHKSAQSVDTTPNAIASRLKQFQADVLIHGHTHRPQKQSIDNKSCYVVGDWRPQALILRYDRRGFCLLSNDTLLSTGETP